MDILPLFNDTIKDVKTWNEFKNRLEVHRNVSGKLFEIFTKYYFIHEPKVKDDYKNVWLYNEIPYGIKKELNIGDVEHGFDLLLEDINGKYCAVQCKFREDETSLLGWSKDKIANLFGFVPTANTYIIFTNASDLDKVSKTRSKNFFLFNIHDLNDIEQNTFNSIFIHVQTNCIQPQKKTIPKPHQNQAITAALNYYNEFDRGQLILPCGAGKTLVALWIKEKMNSSKTLYLVPSLALLRQVKNEWAREKQFFYNYICVCSEKDIDKQSPDTFITHTYELNSRVATNQNDLSTFLIENAEKNIVIFSTYQSLEVVESSARKNNIIFDIVICDEAHKTAGAKLGLFALIHDSKRINASKRLYMTATPRIIKDSIKKNLLMN